MLRLILVGSVLAIGLVASVVSRFAALLLYVWFALFRPQEWLWTNAMADLRLSLVVALLLIVPSVLTGVLPNLSHPLSIGSLLFLGTIGLAQVTTMLPDISWPWTDAFMRLVLVVLFTVTIVNTRRRVLWFLAVLAGSIGFHTAKGGVTAILGGGVLFAEGFAGAFGDNNGYAMAAAMVLPLLWCVAQNLDKTKRLERWARLVFAAAVPLTIFTIIGTMSRAGFLSIATAIMMYIAVQRRRMAPLLTITALVLVALPFIPIPEGYFDRLQTIRTYEETNETSALSRLHFWRVAMRMAADNPLGVGLRNYEYVYDNYDFSGGEFGAGRAVHSSHFQALAETGYLGALLWVGLFVTAFILAFRIRRFGDTAGLSAEEAAFYTTTGNALIVSMATFLVGGAFIAAMSNDITWYTFAAVAATDRVMQARRRELQPERISAPSTEVAFRPRRRATA